MYISIEKSHVLDRIIKDFEVAFRSFISEVIYSSYPDINTLSTALSSVNLTDEFIYSGKIKSAIRKINSNIINVHEVLERCHRSSKIKKFDNDVPYVSELINFIMIFYNSDFSNRGISKGFSSIEEFHYCCSLYHQTRNNLSHPASRPVTEIDANKVLYFIEKILDSLGDGHFWYCSKTHILKEINGYKIAKTCCLPKVHNLSSVNLCHKVLFCRDNEISELYNSIIGADIRRRLAGSVVLYGYGGVGKTAITHEFLHRIIRDKKDGQHEDIEFVLFFSSKDEYLKESKTTGDLYVDAVRPEFSTMEDLRGLICSALNIENIENIHQCYNRGIIAIDNLENINEEQKNRIFDLIKSLPRNVQFIVTSRNEEPCEEKINVEEFSNIEVGVQFIKSIIESEGLNLELNEEHIRKILSVTKGNALIILQLLNMLNRNVVSFDELTLSLESLKSKNSEIIANFMYKNTFDVALQEMEARGYPAKEAIQIISLYDEKIELYSVSKLAKLDISTAESLCNMLLERLVLVKSGEFYELNEFAKRFIFIKLLPERIELNKLKDKIRNHKTRMKEKLGGLENAITRNRVLYGVVTEWQPRNYIDKIVIAELFSLYGEAEKSVRRKKRETYEKQVKEFYEHSFITNHPYVQFQRARLLKIGLHKFYKGQERVKNQIEQAYEESIESIEYDYRFLLGTSAHASLVMLFGIFLCTEQKDFSRAARYLEEARTFFINDSLKNFFTASNYLSISYRELHLKTNDRAYKHQLKKTVEQVLSYESKIKASVFDISRYKQNFKNFV